MKAFGLVMELFCPPPMVEVFAVMEFVWPPAILEFVAVVKVCAGPILSRS